MYECGPHISRSNFHRYRRNFNTAQLRRNQTVLLRALFASFAPWRSNCCPALTAKTQRARRIREKNSFQAAKHFRLSNPGERIPDSSQMEQARQTIPPCCRASLVDHSACHSVLKGFRKTWSAFAWTPRSLRAGPWGDTRGPRTPCICPPGHRWPGIRCGS